MSAIEKHDEEIEGGLSNHPLARLKVEHAAIEAANPPHIPDKRARLSRREKQIRPPSRVAELRNHECPTGALIENACNATVQMRAGMGPGALQCRARRARCAAFLKDLASSIPRDCCPHTHNHRTEPH